MDETMRLLVISNYRDTLNAVRPEGSLFLVLKKWGVDVRVMSWPHLADGQTPTPFMEQFRRADIPVIPYHPTRKLSWMAVRRIRRALLTFRPHILHTFNSKAISNGNFASLGLPVKVLAYRGVIGGLDWWNPNAYLKHLHPRVDAVTAVSKAVQRDVERQIWWTNGKVYQFYKGQNPAWYADVRPADLNALGIPDGAMVVTCVANNRRWKGLRYLVDAFRHLPPEWPVHLLLIGRNMNETDLDQRIRHSPFCRRIHRLGHRTDVPAWLAASDVYVQPSLADKEGLGKGILEAMTLGIPPMVTDTGGPAELVRPNQSGYLVPPADEHAIATVLRQCYEQPARSKQIGQQAKRDILERFSVEASARQLLTIYERVLAGKRSREE